MTQFVKEHSIVRKIWGTSDTILFIFAGAAAEFALNKSVDWLYFTGKLPSDPLGRLFSTVAYARHIVFSSEEKAHTTIDTIRHIHEAVEKSRAASIPDWAYRDVLYMLIHYSVASFELLERPLTDGEKEEVFDVFYRVGIRMGLKNLPQTYQEWLEDRDRHLRQDIRLSHYTQDLFQQYRKHLGPFRYWILIESQKLVIPDLVRMMLRFRPWSFLAPVFPLYTCSRRWGMDRWIKRMLLPRAYLQQILALDVGQLKSS